MHIGFDAKRAFHNKSGLGSYSRNLITALTTGYPQDEFILYTPETNPGFFNPLYANMRIRKPVSIVPRSLPSYWRSYAISRQLIRDEIEVFHGLSHELPFNFPVKNIKSVVTIHDLIFIRLPHLYNPADRFIYHKKFRHACRVADRIIAISRQTASDITELFGTPAEKIDVVHQGCNPEFYNPLSEEEKSQIREKYKLPLSFILYVGTIEERKNLLTLVKALHAGNIGIPLVVIGKPTSYARKVQEFLDSHRSVRALYFDIVQNAELKGFYQLADVFIYPSRYEGFGIPVLESLASKTPVITSRGGCFEEAGGKAALYVNPDDHDELAEAIGKVLHDTGLRNMMVKEGYQHALSFSADAVARNVMNVYKKVMHHE